MIYLGNGLYSDSGSSSNDYLQHFGVLGMRWGVRKQRKMAKRQDKLNRMQIEEIKRKRRMEKIQQRIDKRNEKYRRIKEKKKLKYAKQNPEAFSKMQSLGSKLDDYANKKYYHNPKVQNAFIRETMREGHSRSDAESMMKTDIYDNYIDNYYLDNDKKYKQMFNAWESASEDYRNYMGKYKY